MNNLLLAAQASSLEVTTLSLAHALGGLASLPGRSTNVLDAVGVLEDLLDLLEGLAGRLGEEE